MKLNSFGEGSVTVQKPTTVFNYALTLPDATGMVIYSEAYHLVAGNGIVVNNLTVGTSYTIAAGTSGMSAGPITVSGGVVVTVASGLRWVVL